MRTKTKIFYPVLVILTGFYVFSHVILWVLQLGTVKKFRENAAMAFYSASYDQNLVKIRENPLFSLKSRYLRNTFFETSLARNELVS